MAQFEKCVRTCSDRMDSWLLVVVLTLMLVLCICINRQVRMEQITFPSGDETCAGTLWHPRRAPMAGIVVAHGFGGTADCTSLRNACRHFATAGFLVLSFDYRYFGRSSGVPRQRLSVKAQREDYAAAVNVLYKHVDRIGLWGTSFSGGHTLFVAEQDPRVRACVAQVPALDLKKSGTLTAAHRTSTDEHVIRSTPDDGMIKLVRDDPDDSAIFMSPGSAQFKTSECPTAPSWVNGILAASYKHGDIHLNDPSKYLFDVACPTLVQVANQDELNSTPGSVAFAARFDNVSLLRYECDHFGIYGGDNEREAHTDATLFFERHLTKK